MQICLKSYEGKNHYCEMVQSDNLLIVTVHELYDDLAYPIKKAVYSVHDRKNATATYNRYIRMYCK